VPVQGERTIDRLIREGLVTPAPRPWRGPLPKPIQGAAVRSSDIVLEDRRCCRARARASPRARRARDGPATRGAARTQVARRRAARPTTHRPRVVRPPKVSDAEEQSLAPNDRARPAHRRGSPRTLAAEQLSERRLARLRPPAARHAARPVEDQPRVHASEPPVLEQFVLVQLGPGQHQPQVAARKAAVDHLDGVDRTFAFPSAWRAWKCGDPWSSKNIAITIPMKRLIVGTPRSCCGRRSEGETRRFRDSRRRRWVANWVANRSFVGSVNNQTPNTAICSSTSAPRVGLEPTTLRLTAGCSAN
jgi:hypothetical protein